MIKFSPSFVASSFLLFIISRGVNIPMLISTGAPLRWLAEGYQTFTMGFLPFPASQTNASSFFPNHIWLLCYSRLGAVEGELHNDHELSYLIKSKDITIPYS